MLLPFIAMTLFAQCPPPQRFVPLPVPLPPTIAVIRDEQSLVDVRNTSPNCNTDETGTDCAFVQAQANFTRAFHHAVTRLDAPRFVNSVDGGVCIPPKLDLNEHHLRWSAGSLPLGTQLSVTGADVVPMNKPRLPTPVLEHVRVEVQGPGDDVEVLLLPFAALIHTRNGVYEGQALGPIQSVSVVTDDALIPVTQTLVQPSAHGEVVLVTLGPKPTPFELTVRGGSAQKLVVHGWSDKAWAYDGEAAKTMTVPAPLGRARVEGLKPDALGAPRPYVATASAGGLMGATAFTAAEQHATLTLSAPAIMRVQLLREGGPVTIDAFAFYEMGPDEPDAPTDCESWGSVYWGEQTVTPGRAFVEVRAPPGPRRCVIIRYTKGDEPGTLKLPVPTAPTFMRITFDVDQPQP